MKVVRRPEDCPGSAQDADELFGLFMPEGSERRLTDAQLGWGLVAAQDPQAAVALVKFTRKIAGGPILSKRLDLRELAIQAVNMHFRCEFSHRSHMTYLSKIGLPVESIAALPYWRTSPLYSAEQRLVIEYNLAVASGNVADDLHDRVAGVFGEQGAAELALAAALWCFWAVFLNAARPDSPAGVRSDAAVRRR
jgi:alkylhydroperoxidase family enzyme